MNTPINKSSLLEKWDDAEESSLPRGSADALSYIARLTRQRLLTAQEEIELSARIQRGDTRAKDRLVEANMRLVINIAKNYHNPLVPFEDLVQEGAIGLMTAAERYDPGKGYRFSTYATHWIRQAISRAIDNKAKAIRIPAHVSETLRKLERVRALLFREHGEEPSAEQLAQCMGLSARKVNALLLANQEPVSLDMLVGDEENTTLAALINDRNAANPEGVVLDSEMQKELSELLSVLTPREREIMRRRLGFEDDSAQVLQEIGETLHISRERVRQIEAQALKKLRFAAKRRDLRNYIMDQ
ncbi:MAG TPA: RNA polymerase sigma factor RpoD/SigA [Chthonomonadaceae bacterium]|jgi:RNA polymerase primary sigma factor|nr:RNA polymerase sigma factor RpoD/SigA [Chthonomonadaceae bacterium]